MELISESSIPKSLAKNHLGDLDQQKSSRPRESCKIHSVNSMEFLDEAVVEHLGPVVERLGQNYLIEVHLGTRWAPENHL